MQIIFQQVYFGRALRLLKSMYGWNNSGNLFSNELIEWLLEAGKLYGVLHLTEGGGLNTVVGDFKSLTDVNFWMRANIPPNIPKSDHFIDLDILLEGILQTGVISEEFWNKKVHAERVKCLYI